MSFETLVRPFVSRPIRPPASALPVAPEDKPEQGVAVLRGLGGKLIDLSYSEAHSWSKSKPVEVNRHVAVERVYQKVRDPVTGRETINKENYVDIERMKKLKMREGDGTETEMHFAEPLPDDPKRDNIEIIIPEEVIPNPVVPEEIDVVPGP